MPETLAWKVDADQFRSLHFERWQPAPTNVCLWGRPEVIGGDARIMRAPEQKNADIDALPNSDP
jgi:hypothetical protein